MRTLKQLARTQFRILFFRASGEEMAALGKPALYWGLFITWMVGIGRWWDASDPNILLETGLGSVLYVFALALLLFCAIAPMGAKRWTYQRVLILVTFSALPGLIYAIPVQFWFDIETANKINMVFLAIVAAWRVALLVFFIRRLGECGWFTTLIGTLWPLCFIVAPLLFWHQLGESMKHMGGLNANASRTLIQEVVDVIWTICFFTYIPLCVCWLVLIVLNENKRVKAKRLLHANREEES